MGHFPPKFLESPSSETTGWIEKIKAAAPRRREKQKSCVFVFVCLFVTDLWILNIGLVIEIAILSPCVGQFGCGFQHTSHTHVNLNRPTRCFWPYRYLFLYASSDARNATEWSVSAYYVL